MPSGIIHYLCMSFSLCFRLTFPSFTAPESLHTFARWFGNCTTWVPITQLCGVTSTWFDSTSPYIPIGSWTKAGGLGTYLPSPVFVTQGLSCEQCTSTTKWNSFRKNRRCAIRFTFQDQVGGGISKRASSGTFQSNELA